MKNIFLLICFVLLFHFSFSQLKLGSTKDEINKEFDGYVFESGKIDDNTLFIGTCFESGLFYHIFNVSSDTCYGCLFYPKTNDILNTYIKNYNDSEIYVGNLMWKIKYKNLFILAILNCKNNDDYYFIYLFDKSKN